MGRRWGPGSSKHDKSKGDDDGDDGTRSVASTEAPSSAGSVVSSVASSFVHVEFDSNAGSSFEQPEHESSAGACGSFDLVDCQSSAGSSGGFEHVECLCWGVHVCSQCMSSVGAASPEHADRESTAGTTGFEDAGREPSAGSTSPEHAERESIAHAVAPVAAPSQSECYEDLMHRQLQIRTFFELNSKAGGALVRGGFTPETYFAEFGYISEEAPWGTNALNALLARFQDGRYRYAYQLENADAFGVGYFLAPGHFSALNALGPLVAADSIWYPTLWFRFGKIIYIACLYIIILGSKAWVVHVDRVSPIAAVRGESLENVWSGQGGRR